VSWKNWSLDKCGKRQSFAPMLRNDSAVNEVRL
jgi:hypothetical protein